MKLILIFSLALALTYSSFSQVLTTKEILDSVKNPENEKFFYGPDIIYYIDSSTAMELAYYAVSECSEWDSDDFFESSASFAGDCPKDERICKALFKYFNNKMKILKDESQPDLDVSYSHFISYSLIKGLVNQNPDGLKDSLLNAILYLHEEAKKIHPDSYSFFGDIWQYFSNGMWPYADYWMCMNAYVDIAAALCVLGEDSLIYKMANELDSGYIRSIKSEVKWFREIQHPIEIKHKGEKIELSRSYNSIREFFESDSVIISETKLNNKYKYDTNEYEIYIGSPVIINGNQALFWLRWFNQRSLIKIIFIDANTIEYFDLQTAII